MEGKTSVHDWRPEIRRRLANLQLEPTREAAIVEEIAQYLEDCYTELLTDCTTEAEAHQQTLSELSGHELLQRELRRVEWQITQAPIVPGTNRRTNMIADLWQDLRFGARMLLKQPGFTLIVILTLALGIGANTAIFSVVNAVMLRQLPFANADRLVRLRESNPERGFLSWDVSHPNFLDWRTRNQSFEAMAATDGTNLNLNTGADIEVVGGATITADFLPVLGVAPVLGRNFLPEEDRPGGNTRVVLLAHGFWQRRFGSDSGIVGKTLTINDNTFTVVGVLPESFTWARSEMFIPLAPDPARSRGDHRLTVIGRLKPGVAWERALADMNTIAQQLAQQFPESNKGWSVAGQKFYDWIVPEQSRRSLFVFVGAVIFVLLIACSNVANLVLARASARQKEMAIRVALGAGRFRIIRQLMSEALLLALLAGTLGLLVAVWAVEALQTMNPAVLPRLNELSVDGRVVAFGLLFSLLTGVLFGLFPALQAARPDVHKTLKEGGRSGGASGRQRVRSALVIVEVALSVALLIGAGLLLRSFSKLQEIKPWFEPNNLLTMRISLPRSRYQGNQEAWKFYTRLLQETKALPGVRDAALTSAVPLAGTGNASSEVQIPGRAAAPEGSQPAAGWRVISPGYFRTLGVPLRGRDFDERDTAESQPVAIISEEMARRYWPGEDPLGKTVIMDSLGKKSRAIIGIAGDLRSFGLDAEPGALIYAPTAEIARGIQSRLVVRTRAEPTAQTSAVRGVLRSIDANVPIYDIQTVEQLLYDSLGSRRFNMFLLGSFAGVALLLASVGLFGVMAYLVSQRTHEIGIRLALGARPRDLFRLVIGRGLLLASIGAAVGLAAAFGLARFLGTLLFQVRPTDALSFTAAPVLLLGVALLACYVPARRAMKVDPLVALRRE
jgi:putative ABC transport system permease protein